MAFTDAHAGAMHTYRNLASLVLVGLALVALGIVTHLAFLAAIGLALLVVTAMAALLGLRRDTGQRAPSAWQRGNGTYGWLQRRGERRFR